MKQLPNWQYITHPNENFEDLSWVNLLAQSGVKWIQLRIKENHFKAKYPQQNYADFFIEKGEKIAQICRQNKQILTINDHVEWVNEIGADGAHIGKEDCSVEKARTILSNDKILGVTSNNLNDILKNKLNQIDYFGLGPFRETSTKDKDKLAPTLGLKGYQTILNSMKKHNVFTPVFAIGGIEEMDCETIFKTNIHGIALSGAVFRRKHKVTFIRERTKK